jgi:putative transposase
MSQSFSDVSFHVVFSTKNRRRFFQRPEIRDGVHAYLGRVSNELDCPSLGVGGVDDHVHLLCHFSRTITIANWVKELKRISNLWLKQQDETFADFEWQGEYAVFSVSHSNIERVKKYIANQEHHHRKITFQDELRALLRKHAVEWDERYIWD